MINDLIFDKVDCGKDFLSPWKRKFENDNLLITSTNLHDWIILESSGTSWHEKVKINKNASIKVY